MKKLLVIAALTAAAAPAMASKARVNALGGSRQIVDFQTAFDRPYQFMALGTLATFEWGAQDRAVTGPADNHAEGGFLMKHDEYAYGVYLGRRSTTFDTAVDTGRGLGATNLLKEQNPINLYYASKMGDWTWGIVGKFSNGKQEGAADQKVTSSGVSLGASNGMIDVDVIQGISGKSEQTGATLESKGYTDLTVGYHLDENMEVYANYMMSKVEGTLGTTTFTQETTEMSVGFVNTVVKTEDSNFFYGIAYLNNKVKDGAEKSYLPVWMGIEANATSWMVLRASVTQNVLLNEEKTAAGSKSDLDSIAFAAGAGFRLGKGMLDATFGTANQGHMSFSDGTGDQFLSNVAYTYMF